jgi:hypothetical protein
MITTLFLNNGGVLLPDGWGYEFKDRAVEKFYSIVRGLCFYEPLGLRHSMAIRFEMHTVT